MANRITGAEFNAVKNATYTVISFNKDGRRTMTHGRASLVSAMQEVMLRGRLGHMCIVVNDQQAEYLGVKVPLASWEYEEYAHLTEVKWDVMF